MWDGEPQKSEKFSQNLGVENAKIWVFLENWERLGVWETSGEKKGGNLENREGKYQEMGRKTGIWGKLGKFGGLGMVRGEK